MMWIGRIPSIALPAAAVAIVSVCGCVSAPESNGAATSTDAFAAAPSDLTIDAMVLRGETAPPAEAPPDRAGRYIVLPDGSLYHGEARSTGLPPFIRRLDSRQMARLWSLARQSGLAAPENGRPPVNVEDAIVPADGALLRVVLSAHGERWMFETDSGPDRSADPAIRSIVEELARLAWVGETPPEIARPEPRRYDFGPDPYERYRSGE